MARGKGFFEKLFNRREPDDDDYFAEYEIEMDDDEAADYSWEWDNLIKDRHLLKLSDDVQREKYIRSIVEQVKDASDRIDKLSAEYSEVSSALRDVDELEALPDMEKQQLQDIAGQIIKLEEERSNYRRTKSLMTEGQFQALERFSDTIPKAYEELKNAEEHRKLIKEDLKKLEDEKQGYIYRDHELKKDIANARGMITICLFAAVVCIVMLLILQFGFEMETGIGYMIVAAAVAIAVTVIYIRYLEAGKEQTKIHNGINRIILLQNTVKIRYVNNKQLLDYLYTKYDTKSARELRKVWDVYEEEKTKREQNEENERRLTELTARYGKQLKRYRLNDIHEWLHNPLAVMDHKEMVEVRHSYFLRRQKLRAQIDYNKRLAKEAEKEIRQLLEEYPRYSKEVMDMMGRYS